MGTGRYAVPMNMRKTVQLRETLTGGDPAATPVASLIVLHGLGSDGRDFAPLVSELNLSGVGCVRYVFPDAPLRTVSVNGGAEMRAWYDPRPVPEGVDPASVIDEAGMRASQQIVQALIDREIARGVAPNRIALMGFSQGAVMTLMAGLRAPQRLGGLVALSGYLPLASQTAAEASAANRDVPIFMAHGERDEVVIPARGQASRDALVAMGYDVAWHSYDMAHEVCAEQMSELGDWLTVLLAAW